MHAWAEIEDETLAGADKNCAYLYYGVLLALAAIRRYLAINDHQRTSSSAQSQFDKTLIDPPK